MPEFLLSDERQRLIGRLVERLPDLRKRARMSQDDLGRLIGKSRQKISDMERFAAPMGWDTYLAVCTMLELAGALSTVTDDWYKEDKLLWQKTL